MNRQAAAIPHATPKSSSNRLLIGIDVGGTKIAAGLVNVDAGTLTARREIPTQSARPGQAVLDDVLSLAQSLLVDARAEIAGIGLGVCELVDPHGAVCSAHTVKWAGLPVAATLSRLAPATVESDVRAHALAEAQHGSGATFPTFVFITVGTGISSTVVIDGKPIAGAHGNALVMASSPLEVPRHDAPDGGQPPHSFILEEYASGPALLQRYRAATGRTLDHGAALFGLARTGDAIAHSILSSAGAALGNAVAFLVNVLDPHAIVVGGGLGLAGDPYWSSMVQATRRAIYADATRNLPILQAKLGADAGIIGAALAAHGSHRAQGNSLAQAKPGERP